MSEIEVRVPDLGDTKAATVVDVLVSVGAQIRVDDPLITLESEKASMDIPSSVAGTIASIAVTKGQEVSSGTVIATLTTSKSEAAPGEKAPPTKSVPAAAAAEAPAAAKSPPAAPATAKSTPAAPSPAAAPAQAPGGATGVPSGALELVVIGSGPGGYTAAFRAADLGLKVTLIERWPVLVASLRRRCCTRRR
jgi:dihydrolipoamide dehydrogenase